MNGPTTPIAEVRLTPAQQRALCGDMRSIGNPERFFLYGSDMLSGRMVPTIHALTRTGLLEHGRFGKTMLTELGLAVRAHLLAQSAPVTPISNERGDEM